MEQAQPRTPSSMSDSDNGGGGVFGNIFARDTDSDEPVAAAVGAGVSAAAAEVRAALQRCFRITTATISVHDANHWDI